MVPSKLASLKTTGSFVGASWGGVLIGVAGYLIGLYNAHFSMVEKGLYLTILLYGLFSVISVQKTVRDRAEGIRTTNIYYGVAWGSVIASLTILTVFLWNADMLLVEKGYYGITMTFAMFGVIAVQKKRTRLGDLLRADAGT